MAPSSTQEATHRAAKRLELAARDDAPARWSGDRRPGLTAITTG
jgi:hypothetical protein